MKTQLVLAGSRDVAELLLTIPPEARQELMMYIKGDALADVLEELWMVYVPRMHCTLEALAIEGVPELLMAGRDEHHKSCKKASCNRLDELTSQILAKLIPLVMELRPQITEIVELRDKHIAEMMTKEPNGTEPLN